MTAVKKEDAGVPAAAGLTVSDATRTTLERTVAERRLPFDPLVPNAETIDAMRAARSGDTRKVGSLDELLVDLHAEDWTNCTL